MMIVVASSVPLPMIKLPVVITVFALALEVRVFHADAERADHGIECAEAGDVGDEVHCSLLAADAGTAGGANIHRRGPARSVRAADGGERGIVDGGVLQRPCAPQVARHIDDVGVDGVSCPQVHGPGVDRGIHARAEIADAESRRGDVVSSGQSERARPARSGDVICAGHAEYRARVVVSKRCQPRQVQRLAGTGGRSAEGDRRARQLQRAAAACDYGSRAVAHGEIDEGLAVALHVEGAAAREIDDRVVRGEAAGADSQRAAADIGTAGVEIDAGEDDQPGRGLAQAAAAGE